MWSETVGLRTRPISDQKSVLVLLLVLQVWCCVVKHGLITLVVIMILKDTATFSSTIYSFSILCLEHHYCGDQQWRALYLKDKSTCLCLLPVVLVFVLVFEILALIIWSCLHQWHMWKLNDALAVVNSNEATEEIIYSYFYSPF